MLRMTANSKFTILTTTSLSSNSSADALPAMDRSFIDGNETPETGRAPLAQSCFLNDALDELLSVHRQLHITRDDS